MKNYLNLKKGCLLKKAKVVGFQFRYPQGRKKLYVEVNPENGKKYTVNEVWYKSKDGTLVTQGLWLDLDVAGELYATSALARLLDFMGLNTVGDLLGKELVLQPKENGFLCFIAYNN